MPQQLYSADDAEKIGLRLIRLRVPQLHSTSVVCSMAVADKMLIAWSAQLRGWVMCEFEIMYVDGRVLRGNYEFRRKGAARPSLTLHLRHWFSALIKQGEPVAPVCEGLVDPVQAMSFLERYDAEEFWPVH